MTLLAFHQVTMEMSPEEAMSIPTPLTQYGLMRAWMQQQEAMNKARQRSRRRRR